MSQKKMKELRRLEFVSKNVEETKSEPVKGIRQIIKESWKFLLVVLGGIALLYLNGMKGDFVSDDYASISQNPTVTNFGAQIKGLLASAINWFLANIFGVKSSVPFHVFSLLLYLIVILVAFIFISILFEKKTAKLTIILFALLPVHVEAVTWISGRPYLLNAFFVLVSLIAVILYSKTENKKYLYSFLVLIIVSFLTEQTRFAAMPLLVILYWISFENKLKKKVNLSKIVLIMSLIFLVLAAFLWSPLMNRINTVNAGYNGSDGIFYNPFFQYPTSIAKYLQLILVPTDLTLYHTMYILPVWLNWAIILTYLIGVGYFFFKDKRMFFALAFIFLAASPSMLPVKISWLVAERYIFLGSLGFCLFLVLFFQRFSKKWKIPISIFMVLVAGFYAVRVFLRNIDWQTNHNLWVNTCQVSPNSHNAWNNIGDDYDKLAQLETTDEGKLNQYLNSVKGFTQSVMVKPNYADAYHNRANIFYKIGRYDLARDSYEIALSYGPQLYQSYFSLLQIDLTEKRYDLAMDHLNRLDKVKPNDIQVAYVAAVVYANMGRNDQAIPILKEILKVMPAFTDAKNLLDQLINYEK